MAQALSVEFDMPTATQVAMFFESSGMRNAAARIWQGLSFADPYDSRAREKAAELLFQECEAGYRFGTLARSRMILDVMSQSYPVKKLVDEYFKNLEVMLQPGDRRVAAGQVVLGVGTGRSGSTTLAAMMAGVESGCSTHENPPLVHWEPLAEQVDFHLRRFRMLARYYAVVFDASHWWLGVIDSFLQEFPDGKIIGLYRDTAACVRSFLAVKGSGSGSINHWAHKNNGTWAATLGDPTYPSYPVPANLADDPDAAKATMIDRYVIEYNQALERWADRLGNQMLLVRTEELSSQRTAERLSAFLGTQVVPPSVSLNVGGAADSNRAYYRF